MPCPLLSSPLTSIPRRAAWGPFMSLPGSQALLPLNMHTSLLELPPKVRRGLCLSPHPALHPQVPLGATWLQELSLTWFCNPSPSSAWRRGVRNKCSGSDSTAGLGSPGQYSDVGALPSFSVIEALLSLEQCQHPPVTCDDMPEDTVPSKVCCGTLFLDSFFSTLPQKHIFVFVVNFL